jgi:hypothetical protein
MMTLTFQESFQNQMLGQEAEGMCIVMVIVIVIVIVTVAAEVGAPSRRNPLDYMRKLLDRMAI